MTEPFSIWTQSSTLFHRKRHNAFVPYPNRLTAPFHIAAVWTVSHLNRELGVVTSKKTKLIRASSQQAELFPIPCLGSRLTFVILSKSDPFHIPTDWTVFHLNRELDVVTSKKTKLNRCYIEKDKTDPFHIPTDWTVSHLNRELDVITSKKTKVIP